MERNAMNEILKHKDHYRFKKDGVGAWNYAVGIGDDFVCSDPDATFDSVDAFSYASFIGVKDSHGQCVYANDILLVTTSKSSSLQLALPFIDVDTVKVKIAVDVMVCFDSLDYVAVVGNIYEDDGALCEALIKNEIVQKPQNDKAENNCMLDVKAKEDPATKDIYINKLDEESICYAINWVLEALEGISDYIYKIAKVLNKDEEL